MIRKLLLEDRYGRIFLYLLTAMTLYVACANLLLPADNPMHVSTYTVTLPGTAPFSHWAVMPWACT